MRQWHRIRHARLRQELAALSPREAFTRIYTQGIWGRDEQGAFSSGTGSRDPALTAPYVAATRQFLSSLPTPPTVADVGCGDFRVGAQLLEACQSLVACDIVEPVILDNRLRHSDPRVEFRVLDVTAEAVPQVDVVLLRQVLQHLPNALILAALPNLVGACRHLVVTEQWPASDGFQPNLDNRHVDDTRLSRRSGVVLTAEPFNLRVLSERILCEVPDGEGRLVTTLYQLR